MAHGNPLEYKPLWEAEMDVPIWLEIDAREKAEKWPGFPIDPASPHPIEVDVGKYLRSVRATPALGGRKTNRGVTVSHSNYVSLSNYNNIP